MQPSPKDAASRWLDQRNIANGKPKQGTNSRRQTPHQTPPSSTSAAYFSGTYSHQPFRTPQAQSLGVSGQHSRTQSLAGAGGSAVNTSVMGNATGVADWTAAVDAIDDDVGSGGGVASPANASNGDAGGLAPQERRVADEIALQIGMQVSLVYFAFASMLLGTIVVIQGILLIIKVDGERDDMSWDGVLAPLWILLALVMAALAAYFIGGFADQHVRYAGRDYDDYKMEMVDDDDGNDENEAIEEVVVEGDNGDVGTISVAIPDTPDTANASAKGARRSAGSGGHRHARTMRLTKKPTGPDCTGPECYEKPMPAAATCGSGAARAFTAEEVERMRATENEHFRTFLKRLHAALLVFFPAYVLATSLAGRLAAHPTDYPPWVPFSFALIAEAVIFVVRAQLFSDPDRRLSIIRRVENVPIMCHVGARTYLFFLLGAPVMRVTFWALVSVQVSAITSGRELPMRWAAAFAPLFVLIACGMFIHVMLVVTRHRSNRDPTRHPGAAGVVTGIMLLFVVVTVVAVVLRLDGSITWPLAACIAPAMLVALCVGCIGTGIGCFVASAKVELPAEADHNTTDAVIRSW